jgi:hypothetical protein
MEKDKKYYLTDIESGQNYEVTKEQYEGYQRAWTACRPEVKGIKGRIFLAGTGGKFDDSGDLEKMFYDPQNYKIIKWDE